MTSVTPIVPGTVGASASIGIQLQGGRAAGGSASAGPAAVPGLVDDGPSEPTARLQLPRDDPLFPVLERVLRETPPPKTDRILAPGKLRRGPRGQRGRLGSHVEDYDGLWHFAGDQAHPPPVHYRRLVIAGGKVIDRDERVTRIQQEGEEVHWYGRPFVLSPCGDKLQILGRHGRYVMYERA